MHGQLAYSVFMVLAFVVFLLARRLQPATPGLEKLTFWQRAGLFWGALVGAAVGAKVGFALADGSDWFARRTWLSDGKTLTLGLVGAYVGVELVKVGMGIAAKTGDSFALPLALSLAVGRWGCFFNGCCYGVPTDQSWGVDFGDGLLRHPVQIYESLFHLVLALVLAAIIYREGLRQQRLKFYLIAYAVFRFATEWLRPEPPWWLGLTFYQWVCVFMVVALAVQWLVDKRSSARSAACSGAVVRGVEGLDNGPAR